jgi:uncharacterized membrane protein
MFTAALLIAAVGTACVGGAVFAFSLFVMPALNRLAPAESIRAMQSINLRAERAPFGLVILAPFFAAVGLAIAAVVTPSPASPLVLSGAALYVLVGLGVTGVINVPLNNRLARVGAPPASPPQTGNQDAATWTAFERPWVRANHVRSAGALLASACFTAAALVAR